MSVSPVASADASQTPPESAWVSATSSASASASASMSAATLFTQTESRTQLSATSSASIDGLMSASPTPSASYQNRLLAPGSAAIVVKIFVHVAATAADALTDAVFGTAATGSLLEGLGQIAGVSSDENPVWLESLQDLATGNVLYFSNGGLLRRLQSSAGSLGYLASIGVLTSGSTAPNGEPLSTAQAAESVVAAFALGVMNGPLGALAASVADKYALDSSSVYSLGGIQVPRSASPTPGSIVTGQSSAVAINTSLLGGAIAGAVLALFILIAAAIIMLACGMRKRKESGKSSAEQRHSGAAARRASEVARDYAIEEAANPTNGENRGDVLQAGPSAVDFASVDTTQDLAPGRCGALLPSGVGPADARYLDL
jgi:trimeric autotransporter adhesin